MNTYTDTVGRLTFEKINNLNNLGFISKVKIIFKEVLFGLKYSKYEVIKNRSQCYYDKIILTWGLDGSIDKKGKFQRQIFKYIVKRCIKYIVVRYFLLQKTA